MLSAASSRGGHAYWAVRCTCGAEKEVRAAQLASGQARCGKHTDNRHVDQLVDNNRHVDHVVNRHVGPVVGVSLEDLQAALAPILQAIQGLRADLAKTGTSVPAPKKQHTVTSIGGTGDLASKLANFAASMEIVKAVKANPNATAEQKEDARQRLVVEGDAINNDSLPSRQAARLAILRSVY